MFDGRRHDQADGLRRLFRRTPPQVLALYACGRQRARHALAGAHRLACQSERVLIIDEAEQEASLAVELEQTDAPDLLQLLDGRTLLSDVLQPAGRLFGRLPAAAAALALPLLDEGRRACLTEALRLLHRHVDAVVIHAEWRSLDRPSPFVMAAPRTILLAEASASGAREAYQAVKTLAAAGVGSVLVTICGAGSREESGHFFASLDALVQRHVGIALSLLGDAERDDLSAALARIDAGQGSAAGNLPFLRQGGDRDWVDSLRGG